MNSWRNEILKEFTPKVARLTLVADPDGLLLEEDILEGIRVRGFELIPFEDHIAFRYAYETKFRSHWDCSEQVDLVVVLRSHTSDLSSLPYDLLHAGRQLSFSLGNIFPNLCYPVVNVLDRGDLNALYEAQERYSPGQLGENATKEFVLRHVFEIAPELIKQTSDLLRVLLRRHYCNQRIPNYLDKRFIQLLRQNNTFDDWPLETLVPDREAFFTFLQERWPFFLNHEAAKKESSLEERKQPFGLTFRGPVDLPFDHNDIRIYIDNLFLEGLLHPVSFEHADVLIKSWASIGVVTPQVDDKAKRLDRLIKNLQSSIPTDRARYGDWFQFAHGWAELLFLTNEESGAIHDQTGEQVKSLQTQLDTNFTAWLLKRYAGLVNLPPVPPVMLHHLPKFLLRQFGVNHENKVALIIVDGLAMDQWLVIRDTLASQNSGFRFREQSIFAWIPTLTSVSRQAAFAGKSPLFFPDSILSTDKESTLWMQFWVDQGFSPNEVVFVKGLGGNNLESLSEELSHPKAKVAGLVVDKVDKIMHGMELGTAGMHNQVRQWAQQPYLKEIFELLLKKGFFVYLTSDHGNISANGCGRPSEGVVADLRGERVRIYSEEILRRKIKDLFPTAMEWDPIGLPNSFLPLLSAPRKAFVREDDNIITHGGISIEELIVPLVQIERSGE